MPSEASTSSTSSTASHASHAPLATRLIALYRRRIVNVNVNIVTAGLLALLPTTFAAHAAEHAIGQDQYLAITAVTFVADAVSDVAVYYLLHWIANHTPAAKAARPASAAYGHLPYLKDATLVQFERMCLSPLLYLLALATQYGLMRFASVSSTLATIVGFCLAILITRVLHTTWMVRAERRAAAKVAAHTQAGAAPDQT